MIACSAMKYDRWGIASAPAMITLRANVRSCLSLVFRTSSGLEPPPILGPEHFPQPYSLPRHSSSPVAASTKPPPLMTHRRGLSITSMMRVVSYKKESFSLIIIFIFLLLEKKKPQATAHNGIRSRRWEDSAAFWKHSCQGPLFLPQVFSLGLDAASRDLCWTYYILYYMLYYWTYSALKRCQHLKDGHL